MRPVQLPLHCVSVPHEPWLLGGSPEVTGEHVPSFVGRLQALHVAVQAWSQQVLSAQIDPAMQPPSTASQRWPRLALHSPLLSQVPAHPVGSSPPLTAVHALLVHVWQAPGQWLRWVHPTHLLVPVSHAPLPHWPFWVHWTQAPLARLHAVRERPAQSLSEVHLVH